VVFHDTVPAGATIESAAIDQGSCTVSATEVTCTVPHLDSGGTVEANIVIVEPPGDAMADSTLSRAIVELDHEAPDAAAAIVDRLGRMLALHVFADVARTPTAELGT
jgi:hypothetical protein